MTLIEALVVVVIVGVLTTMLFPFVHSHRKSKNVRCLHNLRQTGVSWAMWTADHLPQKLPMECSTNNGGTREFILGGDAFQHFSVLSNYVGGRSLKVFTCPFDENRAALNLATLNNSNLSYFANLDAQAAQPNSFLAGDRFIAAAFPPRNGLLHIGTNSLLRWTEIHDERKKERRGNLVRVSGEATSVPDKFLQETWRKRGMASARLLLPE